MDETNELEMEEIENVMTKISEGEPPLKKFKLPPMCGICSQMFDSRAVLHNHEMEKHAEFVCNRCNTFQISMESHFVIFQSESDMQSPLVMLLEVVY